MKIHEVTGVGAFVNAPFHSTPGEWCVLSSVLCWYTKVASKGNHLKCLPMVSACSQFRSNTL